VLTADRYITIQSFVIFQRTSQYVQATNKHYQAHQVLTAKQCYATQTMGKVPTPLCTCPEETEQTGRHLMIECRLLSKERPTVLQNLPLPLIMEYHMNTDEVSRFFKSQTCCKTNQNKTRVHKHPCSTSTE